MTDSLGQRALPGALFCLRCSCIYSGKKLQRFIAAGSYGGAAAFAAAKDCKGRLFMAAGIVEVRLLLWQIILKR
jgi:hypothetical protein